MSDDETTRPGPEPKRLNLSEEDWHEAVRKALEGNKPPEDEPPEGQDGEDEPE